MRGAFCHVALNAKLERPAEIHKQIVAVYGNVMNPLVSSSKETPRWEKVRRRYEI